jgi:hypothetical protein
MCDASVRFVPQTLDILVWRGMSTAAGAESLQMP